MENENILKDRRKRCIQWNLELPEEPDLRISSETFLFKGMNCHLEFCTGGFLEYSSLTFVRNGEMRLSEVVTLRVFKDYEPYSQEIITISNANANQVIWRYTAATVLNDCRMLFEITFHVTCMRRSKAVQTSPYIDANVQLEAVSKDFSNLLDAGPNPDVEFLCGGQTIKAHKNVICCRSSVFASMLGTDMQEGKTGRIHIRDMESSVLHQFLRYLYTGVLPNLTFDTIVHMYQVADKYAVDSLKNQCASFLIDNFSHENACDLLILSDRHNDSGLKNAVMEYMFEEKIPRIIGEKWVNFSKDNMALANEVLYRLYMMTDS